MSIAAPPPSSPSSATPPDPTPVTPPAAPAVDLSSVRHSVRQLGRLAVVAGAGVVVGTAYVLAPTERLGPLQAVLAPDGAQAVPLTARAALGLAVLALLTAGGMALLGLGLASGAVPRDRPLPAASAESLRRTLVALRAVGGVAFVLGLLGLAVSSNALPYEPGSTAGISYDDIPGRTAATAEATTFLLCAAGGAVTLRSRRLAAVVAEALAPPQRTAFEVLPLTPAGAGPSEDDVPAAVRSPPDDPLRPWRTLVGALALCLSAVQASQVKLNAWVANESASVAAWTTIYNEASRVPDRWRGSRFDVSGATTDSPVTGAVAVVGLAAFLVKSVAGIVLTIRGAACVAGRFAFRRAAVATAATAVAACGIAALCGAYLNTQFLGVDGVALRFGSTGIVRPAYIVMFVSPATWAAAAVLPAASWLLLTRWPARELFAGRRR
ncbi:MAG TPA: hypothetical protein VF796_20685 [Humisphaera sp.]